MTLAEGGGGGVPKSLTPLPWALLIMPKRVPMGRPITGRESERADAKICESPKIEPFLDLLIQRDKGRRRRGLPWS